MPFGSDGSVSAAAFEARYENELANEYGNLAARTIAMVDRYRDGVVPAVPLDGELASDFEGLPEQVAALIDKAEVTQALETIWERVRRCNQYVEERAPWALAKDEANSDQLDVVLASLCEALRSLTVLLAPWLPASAEKLLGALGASDDSFAAAAFGSGSLAAIEKIEPMFPKDAGEED